MLTTQSAIQNRTLGHLKLHMCSASASHDIIYSPRGDSRKLNKHSVKLFILRKMFRRHVVAVKVYLVVAHLSEESRSSSSASTSCHMRRQKSNNFNEKNLVEVKVFIKVGKCMLQVRDYSLHMRRWWWAHEHPEMNAKLLHVNGVNRLFHEFRFPLHVLAGVYPCCASKIDGFIFCLDVDVVYIELRLVVQGARCMVMAYPVTCHATHPFRLLFLIRLFLVHPSDGSEERRVSDPSYSFRIYSPTHNECVTTVKLPTSMLRWTNPKRLDYYA